MNTIGHLFGLTKATEVLIVTLIGICCTIFDASILDLNTNLGKVWSVPFDPEKFSENSQMFIKYLLSGIVLVRTFSVHLYLAFYIVMLWPAVFEERPNLLLPWLTVGAVKSLGMGFFAFTAGMYACFVYGAWRPACIDFFFAQIIDNAPSMYAWIIVLSYYRDLKSLTLSGLGKNLDKTNNIPDELVIRRRMTRSINADPLADHKNDSLTNRVRSDTSTIESRSLDSLLVKISNDGYVEGNVSSEVFANSEEDPNGENYVQRTIKVLDITDSDIQRAKIEQKNRCPMPSSGDLLQLLDSNVQKTINESTFLSKKENGLNGPEVSNKTDKIKGKELGEFRQIQLNDNKNKNPKMDKKEEVMKINGVLECKKHLKKQICKEEAVEKIAKKRLKTPNEENVIEETNAIFKLSYTDLQEDKKSRLSFSETSSHSFSGSSIYNSHTMSTFFHQFVQNTKCENGDNRATHNEPKKNENSDKEMLTDESEIYSTNYEKDGSQSDNSESAEVELCNPPVMHSACFSKIIKPVDSIKYLGLKGKCHTTLTSDPKSEENANETEEKSKEDAKYELLSVDEMITSPQDCKPKLKPLGSVKPQNPNKLFPKNVYDGYTQDYLKKFCKTNVINEEIVDDHC